MNQTEPLTQPKIQGFGQVKATGIIAALAFFGFYVPYVSIHAAAKAFWFDELFTYYICRLPTFHDSWQAVLHGVDLNPPLFYILTRMSLNSIGGPVGTRLPEMVGFATLCLCLFRFVSARVGTLGGSVAMIFPLLTGAFFYADEARPHGIVLGFCGLALVSWQMTLNRRRALIWDICLGAALAGAFLTHCYAILIGFPFVIAEMVIAIRTRRIRWSIWVAMAIPGLIGALVTLRLLSVYKALTAATTFNQLFPAGFANLAGFYIQLLGHFLTVFALLFPLFIYRFGRGYINQRTPSAADTLPPEELALAIAFITLPILGLLLAKAMHGPFIDRYFMSAVIGFAVLLGHSLPTTNPFADRFPRRIRIESLPALVLLLVMIAAAAKDLLTVIRVRHEQGAGAEALIEPSSGLPISMVLGDPLSLDGLVTSRIPATMPIAVVDPLGFLPLAFYDPSLAPRLFHVNWILNDSVFPLERNLRQWCPTGFHNPISSQDFLRAHREFAVYGRPPYLKELAEIVAAGAQVRQLYVDQYHFLAEVETSITPSSIQQ